MDVARAQCIILDYLARWGIRVVRGGCEGGFICAELLGEVTPLQRAGIFRATFEPQVPVAAGEAEERERSGTRAGTLRSAVDVPQRTIYWPADAVDPYFLLHEGAHLVEALLTGIPPVDHDEDGPLAAFEYLSVKYLERRDGCLIFYEGCEDRRCWTGDELPSHLMRSVEDHILRVVEDMLFVRVRVGDDACYKPTFWLPRGDLLAPMWEPSDPDNGADAWNRLRDATRARRNLCST